MYALIDGNNFYVSCERVFQPRLNGRPVVVLSNNDGCAISRSNEAKAIGIRMGAPWHEIRHMEQTHGLIALSANFELYGDMSNRVMSILAELGPRQEIYSIDECFVEFTDRYEQLSERAHAMRERVLQWTGIPCSVGIGSTKTLAKLANHVAKTAERESGVYPVQHARVCNLETLDDKGRAALLLDTDVGEVWGVGPRLRSKLQAVGVHTALDLAQLDPIMVQRRWSVGLERTVRELQGTACVDLDDEPQPRQHIAVTRSFGQPVTAIGDLQQAVTVFASRAAEKLRLQHSAAAQVLVYIRTSPYRQTRQTSRSWVLPLQRPTNDTMLIVRAALAALKTVYKTGYLYAKAGVILLDLQDEVVSQGELDLDRKVVPNLQLAQVLDKINQRYGQDTIFLASAGLGGTQRSWSMRQLRRTPRYTTRWDELLVVKI